MSDSMPALASSPARARTVTFMPPESPTPGGASGEECTERTPTRRIGCACVSTRAPRSLPLRDRDAKHPRVSTRGCSHATGVWWLLVAATSGGPPGYPGELLLADLGRRLLDRLGVGGDGLAGACAGGLHRRAGRTGAAADPGVGGLGPGDGRAGRLGGLAGRARAPDPGDQALAPADEVAVGPG